MISKKLVLFFIVAFLFCSSDIFAGGHKIIDDGTFGTSKKTRRKIDGVIKRAQEDLKKKQAAQAAKNKPKPAIKPQAKPAAKPKAKPAAKPKAAPATKPKPKPTVKPKAAPLAKPKAKPAAKPKATPAAKPKAKPVAKLKAAPLVQLKAKSAAKPKSDKKKAGKKSAPSGQNNIIWEGRYTLRNGLQFIRKPGGIYIQNSFFGQKVHLKKGTTLHGHTLNNDLKLDTKMTHQQFLNALNKVSPIYIYSMSSTSVQKQENGFKMNNKKFKFDNPFNKKNLKKQIPFGNFFK